MTTQATSNVKTRREKIETIIFGTETGAGQVFDILLLVLIGMSVTVVMLDSVPSLANRYGDEFTKIEIWFTGLFAIEYLTRIWCSSNRRSYILSFWGIVDLLAILPTILTIIFPEAAPLVVVRLMRMMRVFRVLHLFALNQEVRELIEVFKSTSRSIGVFFAMVMVVVVVFGCLLYVVEGPEYGFESIPTSIYWAVVTITTVGYGDIIPGTMIGRILATIGMLIGYSILAVPTGIITAKLWERLNAKRDTSLITWQCPNCKTLTHVSGSKYCGSCGANLGLAEKDT